MKAFEYAAPRTEAEVLDLLSSEPETTQLLAGGTASQASSVSSSKFV